MAVLKLKILWLFLIVFQMGCVVKSEEYDLDTTVKNLYMERNINMNTSKADLNHLIIEEITSANVSNLNDSKEGKLNNAGMHYQELPRYNAAFDNASKQINNLNENKGESSVHSYIDNSIENTTSTPHERADMDVNNQKYKSSNFTTLEAYSENSTVTPRYLHFSDNSKNDLYTNSSTSAIDKTYTEGISSFAISLPGSGENQEYKQNTLETQTETTESWNIDRLNLSTTTENYDGTFKSPKSIFNNKNVTNKNEEHHKLARESWNTYDEDDGFKTTNNFFAGDFKLSNLTSSNIDKEENIKLGQLTKGSLVMSKKSIFNIDLTETLFDGIFNKSNFTQLNSNTEQNTGIIKVTKNNSSINSVDISDASLEDDVGGSENDFNNMFKQWSSNENGNGTENFSIETLATETLDVDSQEIFNTTVEEIFNNSDSDFKYPEPQNNSTGPKNDVIDRWLIDEKENLPLVKDESSNRSASYVMQREHFPELENQSVALSNINFEENGPSYINYDDSNTALDYEETRINQSDTEIPSKPSFSFPEQSHSEQEVPLQEERFELQNNKLTTQLSFLGNYKISSNLHNSSNETEFENKQVVNYISNIPMEISSEVVSINEGTLLNNSAFNEKLLTNNLQNFSENWKKKEFTNQSIEKSEAVVNDNLRSDENANNNTFAQHTNFRNTNYNLNLAQAKTNNGNVSKLNLNAEDYSKTSNISPSAFLSNDDLRKTLIDYGRSSAESQISKPTVTILPQDFNNRNSSRDSTLLMSSNTNLEDRISNGQSLISYTSSFDYQSDKIISTHNTDNIKLTTTNYDTEEERLESEFFDNNKHEENNFSVEAEKVRSIDLIKNESRFNITTESRTGFSEDDDKSNIISGSTSITKKNTENISNKSHFYGKVCTTGEAICTSLNLTIKIFVNDTELHLPPNIYSVEENHELQNTNVLLKWKARENLYNISAIFHVRCKNRYCFVDGIHVTVTKYTSAEILQDDLIGESVEVQKEHLELFKTELGTTYENNAETKLPMKYGITIYLSNVKFFVEKNLITSSMEEAKSACLLADYSIELIGGAIGIILFGGIVLLAFKKLRKEKDTFIPTVA